MSVKSGVCMALVLLLLMIVHAALQHLYHYYVRSICPCLTGYSPQAYTDRLGPFAFEGSLVTLNSAVLEQFACSSCWL